MAGDTASGTKIEYVIFDMDGLLIDSERIYTDVTNNILARFGKTMTWDIKAGLMGKPERQAAEHLLSFFPNIPLTIDDYLRERDAQQDLLWPHVQPLPGALRLVQHLHKHNIPIALASGSRRAKFELKTGHLGNLFGLFGERVICGDDVRIPKGRGKPCPDIFLLAAQEFLGLPVGDAEIEEATEDEKSVRSRMLVFEDAIPGVQAAKRAGMNAVWVADSSLLEVEYSGIYKADEILHSLEEFDPAKWGLPPYA
ncbi:HAD-like protein [Fomitiporia mediterranea MF3/22]|uniref:HAD-like protein n=1 Tax=Fomitiporia mediterranea (strain MF3/22) TaxID=694068 RepID=UPI0004408851|nr:HAD-like protein [Fomitiporia mediterranea MF3/22]EJD02672.1 HAD-like protein [Fomitiporia mediterranea MF3/22]